MNNPNPTSIAPGSHDQENHRRAIINKETLVPIGMVFGLAFLIFQAAVQWTTLQLRVLELEKLTNKHERHIDNINASMVFWRREVEKKLGPLPDYKPSAREEGMMKNDNIVARSTTTE